ncbi:MAG TPA: right-handed parallel beta-helix repeat-containing protein [Planctomycetota bacterium]|nr:right-handed parallel beta-helix repeat-containing protein [Planctomycetota bacterium]
MTSAPILLFLASICPFPWMPGGGERVVTVPVVTVPERTVVIDELPFTIDEPGRYLLAGDLSGVAGQDGLRVAADEVLLDLGGFALSGVLGSAAGIRAVGQRRNITILRGTVQRWGDDGLDLATASTSHVSGLTVLNNGGHGIHLGDNCSAADCQVQLNHGGRGLLAGREARISAVRANGNEFGGIEVGFGGTVVQCLSVGNLSTHGIKAGGKSLVRNSTARGNHGAGIEAGGGSLLIECGVFENIDHGLRVGGDSMVAGCESTGSVDGHGLLVAQASFVSNSQFKDNRHLGLRAGPGVVVSACEVTGNRRGGIVVAGAARLFNNRLDADLLLEGGGIVDGNTLAAGARIMARRVPAIIVRNGAGALEAGPACLVGPLLTPSESAGQEAEQSPWANRIPLE